MTLSTQVVVAVGLDWIGMLELLGHCLRQLGHADVGDVWQIFLKPAKVTLRLVDATITKRILLTQGQSELDEPLVVGEARTNPLGAGVVAVGLAVGGRRQAAPIHNPVGRI